MGDAVDRPEQGLARRHWYADERFRFMGDEALNHLWEAVRVEAIARLERREAEMRERHGRPRRGSEDDGA